VLRHGRQEPKRKQALCSVMADRTYSQTGWMKVRPDGKCLRKCSVSGIPVLYADCTPQNVETISVSDDRSVNGLEAKGSEAV
jgi:ribosomal protein L24E